MPELLACPRCGRPAPDGRCPDCDDRFGRASTVQRADTPADADPTREYAGEPATQDHAPAGPATGVWTDADSTAPGTPAVGARPVQFGNYELREELGRGGMGVVFRAVQAVARREVAVKVLLGGAAGGAVHGGRFEAEVSALANLRHPNIVAVFEVGEVGGSAFFSMEFAPNGTLAARLKDGPLPFAAAAALVGKLADATAAAHALGVLHRDIKPANVLIGADGEPKLSDFGLAKWVDRDESLTASGAVMGTPSYMPPEQARGAEVGPAADVYALGATLYECVCGQPPFRGKDASTIIRRVLADEPAAPRSLRRDTPPELEAIVLRCLEKQPEKRYATPRELADDLRRWQQGESTVARPLSRGQRLARRVKRNRKRLAAAALALAAVGGVIAAWPREKPAPPPPVAEIEAALKRGERVELVGATGAPKYQRWAVGVGDAPDPPPGQPFMIQSLKTGLLELTPDSHADRFRLTAEFRQDASLTSDSSTGVFFCFKSGVAGAAGSADRVLVLRFEDDQITNTPVHRVGDPFSLYDFLAVRTPDVPFVLHGPSPATLLVNEVKPVDRSRPWRKVVAEVTPEGVQAFWRNPDGTTQPILAGGVPSKTIHGNVSDHRQALAESYPGVGFDGLGHTPRGGVGLYVRDARSFFRNVVLEPLSP